MIMRRKEDTAAGKRVAPAQLRSGAFVPPRSDFPSRAASTYTPVRLQKQRRAPLVVAGAVALIGSALHCGITVRRQRAWDQPHGRYSARQILRMADCLYSRIAPIVEGQTGTAEYQDWPLRHKRCRRAWDVLYTDKRGVDSAYFVWNADTGQLLEASSGKSPEPPAPCSRLLRPADATAISARLLTELGMMDTCDHSWRLAEPPEMYRTAWTLKFASGEKRISIAIDAHTGALRTAFLW